MLSNADMTAAELREALLRYWLPVGRGGVQQCMEAASFLLRQCGADEPLRLREFLRQWTALMRASSRTLMRIARTKQPHAGAAKRRSDETSLLFVVRFSLRRRHHDAAKRGAARLDGLTMHRWD